MSDAKDLTRDDPQNSDLEESVARQACSICMLHHLLSQTGLLTSGHPSCTP